MIAQVVKLVEHVIGHCVAGVRQGFEGDGRRLRRDANVACVLWQVWIYARVLVVVGIALDITMRRWGVGRVQIIVRVAHAWRMHYLMRSAAARWQVMHRAVCSSVADTATVHRVDSRLYVLGAVATEWPNAKPICNDCSGCHSGTSQNRPAQSVKTARLCAI